MTHIEECPKCGGKYSSDRCPDCGRKDDLRRYEEKCYREKQVRKYREKSYEEVNPHVGFIIWKPNKDANHMLIVCDWLKEQIHEKYSVKTLVGGALESYAYSDKDIFEEVRQAFMKYIEQ